MFYKNRACIGIFIAMSLCASSLAQHSDGAAISVQGQNILKDGKNYHIRGFITSAFAQPAHDLLACQVDVSLTEKLRNICAHLLRTADFYMGRGEFSGPGNSLFDYARKWGADSIRISVNQGALARRDAAYIDELKMAVAHAGLEKFTVLLALFDHRNTNWAIPLLIEMNPPTPMDDETTLQAGRVLGEIFGNDRSIMFETLNEPWSPVQEMWTRTWELWRDGGTVYGSGPEWESKRATGVKSGKRFVGVNAVIRAMRDAGAQNVIIAQGPGLSLEGYPGGVIDPLHQLAFSSHPFLTPNNSVEEWNEAEWDKDFGDFGKRYPYIITAWAVDNISCGKKAKHFRNSTKVMSTPETPQHFIEYIQSHEYGMYAYAIDIPWTIIKKLELPLELRKMGKSCELYGGGGELITNYFRRITQNPMCISIENREPFQVAVLSAAENPGPTPLRVSRITTPPAKGQVSINADNTITYVPGEDGHFKDQFEFEIADGEGRTDIGRVVLNVGQAQ